MRWPLICILFFISPCCIAQQYYETYSPANGLVDARVSQMIQDGSGRIFFLTKDGLSIYDGQRFTNHTRLSGKPVGMINDGMILPDGSLQLLSFNGDWIHSTKTNIAFDSNFLQTIPEVSGIFSFGVNEKLIVSNRGLFLFTNNSVRKIKMPEPLASKRDPVEKVALTGSRIVFNYFLHSNNTIYLLDKDKGNVTDSLRLPGLYNMTTDQEERVLVCTMGGVFQLNSKDLQKGKLSVEKPWFHDWLPENFPVKNIFFDKQHNAWLINDILGCVKINPSSGITQSYSSSDGLLTGINWMFQDRENNYWFIAQGKGVQKLVQTNYEIAGMMGHIAIEDVFLSNTSEDGSLFLFTDKNMMVIKDQQAQVSAYTKKKYPEPVFYWQKRIWTFASRDSLVDHSGKYLSLGDPATFTSIAHYPSPNTGTDTEGNLLLAGNFFSLIEKDLSAYRQPLPYFADNIISGEKNEYWAFCRSNDILKFSFKNGELLKQASFISPSMEPRFAMHWNKDTFWIASRRNGILMAKITDQSVTIIGKLTREDGLSNDFVETLLKIDEKRVAAGTASGLDIITLAEADTLIGNVSSRINHFEPILQLTKDDKGMIYARTENLQLFKYDPHSKVSADYDPQAWLSRITVNGISIDTATTHFSYSKNNFLFYVTSPSFTDGRSINFRFTLAGEKTQWVQNSNKADFDISNLSPGDYHLSVVIRYPGKMYPDKKIGYHFTILPPFWKTWWFIGALLLGILFTSIYIVRTYLQRQLQRQKMIMEKELAIEQERTKMARELHDGLGSMLSGVKHSFSAMRNQLDMNEKDETRFHYNIDKLNDAIKELRNISHSMASESLLKYGLENSLRDYCKHISQSGSLSISFEALSTSEMYLKEEQSFHIFRIVQELLQNIITHSGAFHAIIQLSYNRRRLYLTVEDDGQGFDPGDAKHEKGMGLKNIKSRVRILHGRLDYRSAPSKGTSVMVEIPCEEKK